MSSQGPGATGTVNYNGFAPERATADLPKVAIGYPFDKDSIRDSSDWIAYKKQALIAKEDKAKLKTAHPEIRYGNDYRIQYLLGRYKYPSTANCNTCSAGQNSLFKGGVA